MKTQFAAASTAEHRWERKRLVISQMT
jgi:hypothetical protein